MANGVNKMRAVHRVKMKFLDPMINEIEHLFRGNGGSDKFSSLGLVIEPPKPVGQPLRHTCPRLLREFRSLLKTLHRNNSGCYRNIDSFIPYLVEKAQIECIVEEELGDRAAGSRIDFLF